MEELDPRQIEQKKIDELNLRQEEFCKLYVSEEFFGNGVQTYIEVYKPDQIEKNWYKIACQSASQILSNIKVCKRINELLEEQGLNDEFIDKQLLFLATQHADFGNKLGAIKEYNKLKQRITEKIDHTSKGERIESITYIIPNGNSKDSTDSEATPSLPSVEE